ncbi:HIPL1 protein-like [Malania oleifera]|uniref:HIPL1 protein-like n=1 Tax=Malania oleifera TaxID=397392 RepID=UPI0025ADD7A7|nr:HIPL1 protein-like [Malania oleifera]
MVGFHNIVLLLTHSLLLCLPSCSLPLCTDSRAPHTPTTPLAFCHTYNNGSACCDSAKDGQLQKQFQAMNISDPACASLLKSILCAQCDQFSAELFKIDSGSRPVPALCNSTVSVGTSPSKLEAATGFCSAVWDACQNVSMLHSPFAPSLQGSIGLPVNSTPSTLIEQWQSKDVFCNAFGGSSNDGGSLCFDGGPTFPNNTNTTIPPMGLCLEKISTGSYLNMVAHPDGSDRVFFSDQPGRIWLATVPEQGSGGVLGLNQSTPFIDLTDDVQFNASFGMMGMAFHPNFTQNGRFFASFNCDKFKSPGGSARCSCNSDVSCDPSKLGSSGAGLAEPCQIQTVIAEYTVNGTSSAKTAKPSEVRRIFTMGLPFTSNHGGQILFGPTDGYLYFMMGDGGSKGDPRNFAQNKKSLLGKIMRLDVNNIPSAGEISKLGLWGNYSIPQDNPYSEDGELRPEIWAMGLRNPWRCSFDAERPSYFLCGDVGQDQYEEVDVITKGGNYGWHVYEGPLLFNTQQFRGKTAEPTSLIFPILGYNHSDVNKKEGSAAIMGGYFYRSMTDPCMYGRYLYADLYATALWAAAESPENSGNFSTKRIPFSCAQNSPIQCSSIPGSSLPSLGCIFSFGQDNRKDIFILASSGVYRVVSPNRCNYTCFKENVTAAGSMLPAPSSSSCMLPAPLSSSSASAWRNLLTVP